jgi:hypothetical protein
MPSWLFSITSQYAPLVDLLALIAVVLLAIKNKNKVSAIVLFEFIAVYIAYSLFASSPYFKTEIMIFIYSIGIKDIIFAWILFYIGANSKIVIAYLIASIYCLMVWIAYKYFYQIAFLDMYYLRGTVVTLMMLLQVYGLTQNGGIKRSNKRTGNTSKHNASNSVYGAEWGGANGGIYTARTNSDAESYKGFRR